VRSRSSSGLRRRRCSAAASPAAWALALGSLLPAAQGLPSYASQLLYQHPKDASATLPMRPLQRRPAPSIIQESSVLLSQGTLRRFGQKCDESKGGAGPTAGASGAQAAAGMPPMLFQVDSDPELQGSGNASSSDDDAGASVAFEPSVEDSLLPPQLPIIARPEGDGGGEAWGGASASRSSRVEASAPADGAASRPQSSAVLAIVVLVAVVVPLLLLAGFAAGRLAAAPTPTPTPARAPPEATGRGDSPRRHIERLPVSGRADMEARLSAASSYDCTIPRPVCSGGPLRLELCVARPADPLQAPFSGRECVLYVAAATCSAHQDVPPAPVAYSSAGISFSASLLASPDVHVSICSEDLFMFGMSPDAYLTEKRPLAVAPEAWKAFVEEHLVAPAGAALSTATSVIRGHTLEAAMATARQPDLAMPVEFAECALLVGAKVTVVGELQRAWDGALSVRPFLVESAPAIGSAGASLSGKVFISDSASLLAAGSEPDKPTSVQQVSVGASFCRSLRCAIARKPSVAS